MATGLNGETQPDLALPRAQGFFQPWNFWKRARCGALDPPGQKVVVIGAGNVALDAAVVAKRLGAEQVIVLYRRGLGRDAGLGERIPGSLPVGGRVPLVERGADHALPAPCADGSAHVIGIEVARTRYTEKTQGGRRGVEPDPSQPTYTQACDAVIFALGQILDPANTGLFDLRIEKGLLSVDPATYQSAANPQGLCRRRGGQRRLDRGCLPERRAWRPGARSMPFCTVTQEGTLMSSLKTSFCDIEFRQPLHPGGLPLHRRP